MTNDGIDAIHADGDAITYNIAIKSEAGEVGKLQID
jgi:hypothetical protein